MWLCGVVGFEQVAEYEVDGVGLDELLVPHGYLHFLGVVCPIACVVSYEMEGLCIELSVVEWCLGVDGCEHSGADESACALHYAQHFLVVGGADEGCIPAACGYY